MEDLTSQTVYSKLVLILPGRYSLRVMVLSLTRLTQTETKQNFAYVKYHHVLNGTSLSPNKLGQF